MRVTAANKCRSRRLSNAVEKRPGGEKETRRRKEEEDKICGVKCEKARGGLGRGGG